LRSISRLAVMTIVATLTILSQTSLSAAAAPGALAERSDRSSSPAPLIADGVWDCISIGNGQVCVRYINGKTGVDVKYVKTAGGTITARFSYHDYTWGEDHWDGGWFTQSAGQTRSYAWHNTFPGCVRGFLNTGGTQYASRMICP
jgi:hypothetical protein